MFKEETPGGSQLVEHVPVTVEELRSHFEALGGRKVSACLGRGGEWRGPGVAFPGSHCPSALPCWEWEALAKVPMDVLWTVCIC